MENVDKFFVESNCVTKKETVYFVLAVIITVLTNIILFGVSIFTGFILIIICMVIGFFIVQGLMIAHIQQNGVKITESQFPEIYEKVSAMAFKMSIYKTPAIYLMESGGCLNAFATRFACKNYVVLYSDILELAYEEGENAVDFIIAHELAHIKRNHMGKRIWTFWGDLFPFLGTAYSRACETTCDNMATCMVKGEITEGLLLLLGGKKLYKKINVKNLLDTADNDYGVFAWLNEINSTHPHLSARVENILRFNKRIFDVETDLINVKPRFKTSVVVKIFIILCACLPIVLGIIAALIIPSIVNAMS